MSWMRARANALSVRMRTWWPSSETACPPSAWIASAIRPTVTCSPVEATTSSSRSSGSGAICLASPSRRLVSPDIAETMTTTSWPLPLRGQATTGDRADAFDGSDRGAAVFLDDQQGAQLSNTGPDVKTEKRGPQGKLAVKWPHG